MEINRKTHKIFYGWWIVAACFLNWLVTGGAVILGFTAFFEPIADDLGWSYTHISLAASLRGVESGLLSPFVGFFFDRWGPRKIMLSGTVIIGFGLILLSFVNTLAMFYVGFIIVAFGITGTNPAVAMPTLANWFKKKLGLAAGIASAGFAFGGFLIPLIVKLIDAYSWRTAFVILGAAIIVLGIPFSLAFRHKPEQYGYLPDGAEIIEKPLSAKSESPTHPGEHTAGSMRQALKKFAFWTLTIGFTLQYLAINTVTVHIMPYLSSVGLSRIGAGLVATTLPIVSAGSRLVSGWLSDRFNKKLVTLFFFAAMFFGIVPMLWISEKNIWLLIPFVFFFGLAWGGNATLRVTMMGQHFERSHFGSIFGLMIGIITAGGLIGPLVAGWIYDNRADYDLTWIIMAVLVLLGLLFLASTPSPDSRRSNT